MYDACESGDKDKCLTIHEKCPALLTQNSGPCLLRIAESGNMDCYIAVESLLLKVKGEEELQQYIANIVDADKESMLHKACRSGNQDMYSYLCNTYPSLVASKDRSTLLQITCELNKADIMSLLLPSVKDENDIGKCLTQYPLDDHCKQAVALELKQRLADKVKLQGSYRIEPTFNSVGEVVFLAYGLNVVRGRVEQFAGMTVLYRNPKQVNDEAIRIANSAERWSLNTNNINGMEYAEKAIKMHGTRLMQSHSNINALGVSHLRSRKGGKDLKLAETTLVVIYCSSKGFRPIQEDVFPHQLLVDGIAVSIDVREGFFEIAPRTYSAIPGSDFHPKLKMGCEIDVEDDGKRRGGTIGPFVKIHSIKDDVLDGFLTCAHVAYGIEDGEDSYSHDETNTPTQLQVNQPALKTFPMPSTSIPYDPRCGRTYRGTFGVIVDGVTVDAAVVVVQKDRMPSGGEFAFFRHNQLGEIGFRTFPVFDSAEQAEPTEIMNEEIIKFGAITHATKGVYVALVHVREPISLGISGPTGLTERRFEMQGQLEISSCRANRRFFDLGDSGSGVFVKRGDDLRCLGLGIGCLSNGSAVVTPIKPILKALGVELMSFTEPMDESQ
ncbi:uncharacterized protein LOC110459625 [Mizuhopecten yessoensis]|uniref:Uncharacterized protein n=1 Tax=Mizuhopecten yessoensis TaxID=6573 RepID=A0A210Q497_MIZYE|nr:uncharacterized protein LOC110459625 [Mizuhopecten yessoensis]OWF43509.1 hypothetical protein KP79_PYT23146 [Mizuhopecten yessoensis]